MAAALCSTGSLTTKRGLKLHTFQVLPGSKQPYARLFFHHGVAEYSERFKPAFESLANQGIAVFSYDAEGHGKSDPPGPENRALFLSFQDLVSDLYEYLELINKEYPQYAQLPTFLGGHSLGGLVAIHAALRSQGTWAGLILHSPAVDVEWTLVLRLQVPVSSFLSAVVPKLRMVPAVEPQHMSVDPKAVQAYLSDALVTKGPLPVRTGREALSAMQSLQARYGELTLPLYAAHGTEDKCTSLPATRRLITGANSADKTLNEVAGAYHELLHGPERQECTDRIAEWIRQRAAPATRL